MPIMMRPNGPAKKIANRLLGSPDSMQDKKTRKRKKNVERVLFAEEFRFRR